MWTKDKSLQLSIIVVRILTGFILVLCVCVPTMVRWYELTDTDGIGLIGSNVFWPLTICLYLAAVCGEVCLWHLGKLLGNIKKEIVFTADNCQHLRYISWCCICAAIPFGVFGAWRFLSFIVAIAAGFFGLILHVLKNVFDKAVELQEENDYTI